MKNAMDACLLHLYLRVRWASFQTWEQEVAPGCAGTDPEQPKAS